MKILIDENIPYAKQLFKKFGEVELISGRLISSSKIKKINALIIRSVTKVNEELLKESQVKFVGTTTSGFDHIDVKWLKQNNITFSAALGCNAKSVVEYVFSVLLLLAENNYFDLREKTIGIIGVGHIGSLLNKYLKIWGVNTLLCDPFRANNINNNEQFWPLEKLIIHADILTFHVSLNKSKKYSSYHLLNKEIITAIPNGRILINTSRGSIIDNKALLNILENGKKINIILDVWENEPFITLPLLNKCIIGTPHIAGYSLEGKIKGTTQIFIEFNKFLNKNQQNKFNKLLPKAEFNEIKFNGKLTQENLKRLINLIYDVRRDDILLRKIFYFPYQFDYLRKYYPGRREWSSLKVNCNNIDTANILKKLGFNIKLI